jgi:hypothetical protein
MACEPQPSFRGGPSLWPALNGVMAWGMNLHADPICVQRSLPCVALWGLRETGAWFPGQGTALVPLEIDAAKEARRWSPVVAENA